MSHWRAVTWIAHEGAADALVPSTIDLPPPAKPDEPWFYVTAEPKKESLRKARNRREVALFITKDKEALALRLAKDNAEIARHAHEYNKAVARSRKKDAPPNARAARRAQNLPPILAAIHSASLQDRSMHNKDGTPKYDLDALDFAENALASAVANGDVKFDPAPRPPADLNYVYPVGRIYSSEDIKRLWPAKGGRGRRATFNARQSKSRSDMEMVHILAIEFRKAGKKIGKITAESIFADIDAARDLGTERFATMDWERWDKIRLEAILRARNAVTRDLVTGQIGADAANNQFHSIDLQESTT